MAQFRREQEAEVQELRGRTQLGEARSAAGVAETERDQDQRDLEMLLDINVQYKSSKRQDQQEQLRIRLEAQERELEPALREDREKSETRIRESRAQHGQELERIEVLSTSSSAVGCSDQGVPKRTCPPGGVKTSTDSESIGTQAAIWITPLTWHLGHGLLTYAQLLKPCIGKP